MCKIVPCCWITLLCIATEEYVDSRVWCRFGECAEIQGHIARDDRLDSIHHARIPINVFHRKHHTVAVCMKPETKNCLLSILPCTTLANPHHGHSGLSSEILTFSIMLTIAVVSLEEVFTISDE